MPVRAISCRLVVERLVAPGVLPGQQTAAVPTITARFNNFMRQLLFVLPLLIFAVSDLRLEDRTLLAFPTAEGYGRFALGGRGGRAIHVTNLNDSGPGSLRAAVQADGSRTVIFDVSGLITLESPLLVRNPYLTVAGQTAPCKGICICKYNFGLYATHDVIIRHLRVPGAAMISRRIVGNALSLNLCEVSVSVIATVLRTAIFRHAGI